jgi:hypothetical protein
LKQRREISRLRKKLARAERDAELASENAPHLPDLS